MRRIDQQRISEIYAIHTVLAFGQNDSIPWCNDLVDFQAVLEKSWKVIKKGFGASATGGIAHVLCIIYVFKE